MRKLRFEEFERNSLTVFAISMIANVLSYLYQIVMGNMLTPADYGTVNTMGGGLLLVLPANANGRSSEFITISNSRLIKSRHSCTVLRAK